MLTTLTQSRVKEYDAWKKAFDDNEGLRKSFGAISSQVFRSVSDPNAVTILMKWESMESAQKFAASPDLKAAQQRSGVDGIPAVTFLTEA